MDRLGCGLWLVAWLVCQAGCGGPTASREEAELARQQVEAQIHRDRERERLNVELARIAEESAKRKADILRGLQQAQENAVVEFEKSLEEEREQMRKETEALAAFQGIAASLVSPAAELSQVCGELQSFLAAHPETRAAAAAWEYRRLLAEEAPPLRPGRSAMRVLAVLGAHHWRSQGNVYSAAFSPDGATLASGGDNGSVCLWSLTDGGAFKAKREMAAHDEAVTGLDFSRDGRLLVSRTRNRIRVWTLHDEGLSQHVEIEMPPFARILRVSFTPEGERLAACLDLGDASDAAIKRGTRLVRIWRLNCDPPEFDDVPVTEHVSLLALWPCSLTVVDSRWMILPCQLASMRGLSHAEFSIFDLTSQPPLKTWTITASKRCSLAEHPQGELRVADRVSDHTIVVRPAGSSHLESESRWQVEEEGKIDDLSLTPAADGLWVADAEGRFHYWREPSSSETGPRQEPLHRWVIPVRPREIKVSADDTHLALSYAQTTIVLRVEGERSRTP